MSVSEYALDVDKSVSEILNLCKKLELSISNEDDMLSDDDIIILDNELASIQPSEESTEELEELEELEDIEESYEEQIKEENKAKKKKTAKPTNKNDFKEKRKEMYKHKEKLKSNILKVAHHGSKSSSIQQFLEMVKPEIALIGVGEKNTFGHPNGEVLERLNELRL